MDYIFKLIGAIGLLLVSIGIIKRKEVEEDLYFIFGGLFLEIYSIYIGDIVFIILQIIFVFSALFEYIKLRKREK